MNQALHPNDDYLLIHIRELEMAWRMLASPDKQADVADTLQTVQQIHQTYGPEKALFTIISATAWLVEDGLRPDGRRGLYDG